MCEKIKNSTSPSDNSSHSAYNIGACNLGLLGGGRGRREWRKSEGANGGKDGEKS